MKFIHYIFLLFSLLIVSCYTPTNLYQPVTSPVVFKFEEGSEIIKETYCTSLEKTTDGSYIFKRYYPTTNVLTEQISFKDKTMMSKDGVSINYYDDGTLWKSITYKNSFANGIASIGNSTGNYKDGKRFGNWQTYEDDIKIMSYNYNEKGKMHGPDTSWTKEGKLASIRIFENNELVDEKIFIKDKDVKRFEVVEKMPRFLSKDCEQMESDSLKKACADRAMLMHIYSNIRYPAFARVNEIEGTATISFTVQKDGSISEVKALNGVCDEIKAECIRLVSDFPDFYPGYQKDEPVKVQFNFPIRFRLE